MKLQASHDDIIDVKLPATFTAYRKFIGSPEEQRVFDKFVAFWTGYADDDRKLIADIVAQVQRVTEMIATIAAASGAQASGIGQVGDSVSPLDQMTQQNSALVEESADAAENLRHQAAQLADVVKVFTLQ